MTWPSVVVPPLVTVHPWSLESSGGSIGSGGTAMGTTAGAAWPAAGLAIYVPFSVCIPTTFVQGLLYMGATVGNGNYDIGLYAADGTRLVSKGATTTTGMTVNAANGADLTDTTVGPGRYYMAVMLTSASDTMIRGTQIVSALVGAGVAQEDCSAGGVLPANATFAQMASAYLPFFGLSTRTLV